MSEAQQQSSTDATANQSTAPNAGPVATKPVTVTESKAPNGRKISYTKFLRRISDAELNFELSKRVKVNDAFAVALSVVFNSPLSRPYINQSAFERRRFLDREKLQAMRKAAPAVAPVQ